MQLARKTRGNRKADGVIDVKVMEMVYVMVMVIAMDPGHMIMVFFMAIIMVLAMAMTLFMIMVTTLAMVIFLSLMSIIT